MKIEVIKFQQRDIERCEEFANQQVHTSISHYRKRKQGNESKIITDITTGKLGEIATHRVLRRHGLHAQAPDFEIYESRQKSFDADITWNEYAFHCKSQNEESVEKYGISWILQWGGRGYGHKDKLFTHCGPTDYLVPCTIHDSVARVYGIIPVARLFELNLIKPPRVKWLEDTKRAIYFEDIKELGWRDRWGFLHGY